MTQLMSAGGTLLARADIACHDDHGAVTVGNEAAAWQDRCPAGHSRLPRLALVGAQQRYHVIGGLPSGAACSLAAGNTVLTGLPGFSALA